MMDDMTAGLRQLAIGVFKLNRRMVNVEFFTEDLVNAFQDAVTFGRWHISDQGMATQRMGARSQTPDMDVMNVEHARHFAHRCLSQIAG